MSEHYFNLQPQQHKVVVKRTSMKSKSRGYAAAFQQLESIAESYQVDAGPQPHQQQHQHTGDGNPSFMPLDYHSPDDFLNGYNESNYQQNGYRQGAQQSQQHQQTHHTLHMPNHQYYADNENVHTTYQLLMQRQQEQQQLQQANLYALPNYGTVSSSNSNSQYHGQQNRAPTPSFANLDPMNHHHGASAAHHQPQSSWDDFLFMNSGLLQPDPIVSNPPAISYNQHSHPHGNARAHDGNSSNNLKSQDDAWLSSLSLDVPGLSMEPLSGTEIVRRCQASMDDVAYRYVPCVDFLVQCQQELRKGQRLCPNNAQQFFAAYVQPLPRMFYGKNQFTLSSDAMGTAMEGLNRLVSDAKAMLRMGSEAVKNQFLGGMKDGESWGLRKWLSRQGNALEICNNLECILTVLRKLDKTADSTRKLADLLRPMAKTALAKLQKDIPRSYQEQSSAHPYLPFFHRLEAALRSMSQFEPTKDDVICLDDSDDDDDKVELCESTPPVKKRRASPDRLTVLDDSLEDSDRKPAAKPDKCDDRDSQMASLKIGESDDVSAGSSSGESDSDSVVEIVNEVAALACTNDTSIDCERSDHNGKHQNTGDITSNAWPLPNIDGAAASATALIIASNMDRLAEFFDSGQQAAIRPMTAPHGTFWEGHRYGRALRLFTDILRHPEAVVFLERVDEDTMLRKGLPLFSHIIKHPLSFRDIAASLIWNVDASGNFPCGKDGQLPVKGLSKWNMWKGMDLLQAIDLVFLNSLAYGKHIGTDKRSSHRSSVNKMRKTFWEAINRIIDAGAAGDVVKRRTCTPTRRSETSGFIVYKIQE